MSLSDFWDIGVAGGVYWVHMQPQGGGNLGQIYREKLQVHPRQSVHPQAEKNVVVSAYISKATTK